MILRHRDRELLRFEWAGARGVRVLSVNDAERKFLPIEMAGTVSDESLWKWLTHRKCEISVGIKSTNYDSLEYQILENMRADKAITAAEIADILQVERRTIERKIKFLREHGKVVHMGSRKTGYWQVRDIYGES